MKTLKKLFFLLILPIAFISCNNDDDVKQIIPGTPTGTDVRYKFSVSSSEVVTGFKYKNADGSMDSGFFNIESPTTYTKTIIVKKPFQTRMDLSFQNATGVEHNYTVEIYVDGILSNTQSGIVPIPPVPPVNPQNPFPPFSVSKTYDLE